ncbi:MAG: type II secretion system F family protein [Patescibacteria group bacterium]|nr:type II secretion system F family protein [Patescibacteria group bacterium]
MKFKYKVQKNGGGVLEGYKEAPDKFSLARDLREQGDTPIYIEESGTKEKTSILKMNFFGRVSLSEKIIFTNNLSGMLTAGLPLTRALLVLQKQNKNQTFNKILNSLIDDINSGNTLSDGMSKYPKVFSSLFVSMVHAGEESGSLPKSLSEVGLNLKKAYDLSKKVKSALIYPVIILCAIILIGVLMMIFVVPTLTKTFKDMGADLPASTKFIIWLSDTVSNHTILFLLFLLSIAAAIILFVKLRATQKYLDYLILRVPVVNNISKEVNTARTARTLSSLLSSGVDMSRALTITKEVVQNIYYKKLISQAITSIEKGSPLSASFKDNTQLYPVMMGEMIEVGEETGNLSKMLLDIANFYESEVDNKTKDLSVIIEPVLMLLIGGAVGFFAVSMISPIYSVMSNIK